MKPIQPTQTIYCKKDGFPIINIGGQQQCVSEFLNYCIGGEKITDILLQNETMYYVFESGHEIPLLCNCCGEPLACANLQAERKNMIGRCLVSMSWDWEELEDGHSVIDYRLELSAKENEDFIVLIVQTAVSSANKMRHPAGCTQAPQPARKDEPVPEAAARPKKKRKRR